jgi:hypothetical protein
MLGTLNSPTLWIFIGSAWIEKTPCSFDPY